VPEAGSRITITVLLMMDPFDSAGISQVQYSTGCLHRMNPLTVPMPAEYDVQVVVQAVGFRRVGIDDTR
jgi:hypothetical protein